MLPTSRTASQPCTCGRLRRASRALTQLYDDALAPAQLRFGQFSLLRILARNGSLRISDLARVTLLDRTAIARALDPLVERGFVSVAPGRDARTRVASLSRRGTRALAGAEPHWTRAQQAVTKRLGARKVDALIGLLREVEALHPDPAGLDR